MKKTALTLAVAAVLAVPFTAQADTILYGEAKVSVDYVDNSGGNDDSWDVVNNGSKLGIKGFEELGGGLSAFYQYDFNVDMTEGGNMEGSNQKFVGLSGGFGTLTIGTQDTPYWKVLNIVDIFNSSRMFDGGVYLGSNLVNGFDGVDFVNTGVAGGLGTLPNSLDYKTPDFSGFSAEVLVMMDGGFNQNRGFSDDIDLWNVNLKYNQGPFYAGLSYVSLEGSGRANPNAIFGQTVDLDLDNWAVGLGYQTEQWLIGAIYEQGSLADVNAARHIRNGGIPLATGDDAQSWLVAGQYAFGNNVVRAAYGLTDTGINGERDIKNWRLGYQYNFSKRTLLWAEYFGRDANTRLYGDQSAFSLGMKHLF